MRWALLVFTINSIPTIPGRTAERLLIAKSEIPSQSISTCSRDRVSTIKKLYQEKRWRQIVEIAASSPRGSAELDYYRGMALARLQHWQAAERAFRAGEKKRPADKRFPLELAGVAFKQRNYAKAGAQLRRALRLDPHDPYAIDFLATIEALNQNLEAALQLWNQVEKPVIRELRNDPEPRLDPVLLDHAFAFSPASLLKLEDYRTTRARLDLLGIFPRYQFELKPRAGETSGSRSADGRAGGSEAQGGTFDLVFRSTERNGWGETKLGAALSLLRGLPYETVYPEYFNLKHSAMNISSLLRWDENKRRFFASFSAPLRREPGWRYEIYADAKNEYWDLSQTLHAAGPPVSNLNLQKLAAGAAVQSVINGRWSWSTGLEISHRWFRKMQGPDTPFFANGFAIKYQAGLNGNLLDRPQQRFRLGASASAQLGRFFTSPSGLFSRTQGSLWTRWLPKPSGDDFEILGRVRGGITRGRVPFDELFILGLERDNELWLRAHIGTHNGRKGSAPLGRDYVLSNWEINKNIYQAGLFGLRLAPFLDCGRVYDGSGYFGSQKWLWDSGGQVKLRLFGGLTVVFTYGKDLRSGTNAYYVTVER